MPIRIPDTLPAKAALEEENIFVMGMNRALTQDIRPLKIAILNIMPTKVTTEVQLLRLLSNTPLQADLTLLRMESHHSKNTPDAHLNTFYKTFSEVRDQKFDGLIITGAPVEDLDFEQVDYWDEMAQIIDWSEENVFTTLFICWGAQAGLYRRYGIPKYQLPKKVFGVFESHVTQKNIPLFRGFDDSFNMPHSRHTEVRREDVLKHPQLEIVCESEEAGLCIVMSHDGRGIYVFGHGEYDPNTLRAEYERDLAKGLDIEIPRHYFIHDDPDKPVDVTWRAHWNLFFANWLNYYVYQATPYDLEKIKE